MKPLHKRVCLVLSVILFVGLTGCSTIPRSPDALVRYAKNSLDTAKTIEANAELYTKVNIDGTSKELIRQSHMVFLKKENAVYVELDGNERSYYIRKKNEDYQIYKKEENTWKSIKYSKKHLEQTTRNNLIPVGIADYLMNSNSFCVKNKDTNNQLTVLTGRIAEAELEKTLTYTTVLQQLCLSSLTEKNLKKAKDIKVALTVSTDDATPEVITLNMKDTLQSIIHQIYQESNIHYKVEKCQLKVEQIKVNDKKTCITKSMIEGIDK